MIGIVDSGIDYENPDFRNADGTTRILALWDQTIQNGKPPEGYHIGTEFTSEQINEALRIEVKEERYRIVPSRDTSGHGTAVAGIAAGNGRGSKNGKYRGAAPEAGLLIVKMGEQGNRIPKNYPADARCGLYRKKSGRVKKAGGDQYQFWEYIRRT